MDIRVAGHQVDTGKLLREHAAQRMAEITEKYFSRSVGANVTFGRGPNSDFTCDIVAPVVQGVVLKASYSAREPQMAFNGAADRIEKQLRRYTNRLKDHKVDETAVPFIENAGYTIFATDEESRLSDHRRRDARRYSRNQRVRRGDADGPQEHHGADVQEFGDRRVQHDLPPRGREHRLG